MHLCMCVCVFVCVCMCMSSICARVCEYVVSMCVCMCVSRRVFVCVCVWAEVCIACVGVGVLRVCGFACCVFVTEVWSQKIPGQA